VNFGAGRRTAENAEVEVASFRGAVYRAPAAGFPDLAIILREDDEVLLCRAVASVEEGEQIVEVISRGLAEIARQDEDGGERP
jgi:hypothetical protein